MVVQKARVSRVMEYVFLFAVLALAQASHDYHSDDRTSGEEHKLSSEEEHYYPDKKSDDHYEHETDHGAEYKSESKEDDDSSPNYEFYKPINTYGPFAPNEEDVKYIPHSKIFSKYINPKQTSNSEIKNDWKEDDEHSKEPRYGFVRHHHDSDHKYHGDKDSGDLSDIKHATPYKNDDSYRSHPGENIGDHKHYEHDEYHSSQPGHKQHGSHHTQHHYPNPENHHGGHHHQEHGIHYVKHHYPEHSSHYSSSHYPENNDHHKSYHHQEHKEEHDSHHYPEHKQEDHHRHHYPEYKKEHHHPYPEHKKEEHHHHYPDHKKEEHHHHHPDYKKEEHHHHYPEHKEEGGHHQLGHDKHHDKPHLPYQHWSDKNAESFPKPNNAKVAEEFYKSKFHHSLSGPKYHAWHGEKPGYISKAEELLKEHKFNPHKLPHKLDTHKDHKHSHNSKTGHKFLKDYPHINKYFKRHHLKSFRNYKPGFNFAGPNYGWMYKPKTDLYQEMKKDLSIKMRLLKEHEEKLAALQKGHLEKYRALFNPHHAEKFMKHEIHKHMFPIPDIDHKHHSYDTHHDAKHLDLPLSEHNHPKESEYDSHHKPEHHHTHHDVPHSKHHSTHEESNHYNSDSHHHANKYSS